MERKILCECGQWFDYDWEFVRHQTYTCPLYYKPKTLPSGCEDCEFLEYEEGFEDPIGCDLIRTCPEQYYCKEAFQAILVATSKDAVLLPDSLTHIPIPDWCPGGEGR